MLSSNSAHVATTTTYNKELLSRALRAVYHGQWPNLWKQFVAGWFVSDLTATPGGFHSLRLGVTWCSPERLFSFRPRRRTVARWCQIWQKLPKITVFQKVCQLFWQYFVCQIFAIFKIPTACIGKTIHFGLLIKLISKLNREYNSTQWWDSKFFKKQVLSLQDSTTGSLIITTSRGKPCQQPVLGIKEIPRTGPCEPVESHHWLKINRCESFTSAPDNMSEVLPRVLLS